MSYLREHDEHIARSGGFSADYVTATSWLGTIEIESCDSCPLLWVRCIHEHNTWNTDGSQLTCDLCGVDGT
jgi:hypothetical protein